MTADRMHWYRGCMYAAKTSRRTDIAERVTCKHCLNQLGPAAYGDNYFKGLGRLMCVICGGPIRDHPVGPMCKDAA